VDFELLVGFPPVIEGYAHLYNLLVVTHSSLYSHLVELQVKPQFFALRWFRVFFGREFVLQNVVFVGCNILSTQQPDIFGRR
jgi:TBC1 domain family protein 5